MRLAGHLDRCDTEGIGGWVVDLDNKTEPLELAFYAGDHYLGHAVADRFRQDLADAHINEGNAAFRFTFSEKLSPSLVEQLEVRISSSGYKFSFSSRTPVLHLEVKSIQAMKNVKCKRFDRCILHIGTEKTGSTSLQAMLADNRKILSDHGFFFPESLSQIAGDGNHCHIAAMALRDDAYDEDLRGRWGIKDSESLHSYRLAQAEYFQDEVAASPDRCNSLIISNEHCHSRLLTIEEVQRVKDFLEPYCEKFEIVVYLRPQFELALSQYGMMVLNGFYDIEPFPPLPYPPNYAKRRYTNQLYFDYQKLLERWSAVFGREALQPRIYPTSGSAKSGSVSDFLEYLSLDENQVIQPRRENTNVSAEAQAFLIRLYEELSLRGHDPSGGWADPIRNTIRKLHPGSGLRPSKEKIKEFQSRFDKSNEGVRANWFPDRDGLFIIDYTRYPDAEETVLDEKIIFSMFVDVMKSCMI